MFFVDRYSAGSPPVSTGAGVSSLMMQSPLLYFQPTSLNAKGTF